MKRIDTDLLILIITLFWLNSLNNNLNSIEIIGIFMAAAIFLLMVAKLIKDK